MTLSTVSLRQASFLAFAAPLALALAACGGSETEGELPVNEPIAAIAPPEGQHWFDVVEVTPEGGYLAGNPAAPIKLVEYGSHTCPACALFSVEGMEKLRDDYVASGRVSYEFRSVPIHGAVDLIISRIIQCVPKEAAVPLAEEVWNDLDAVLDPVQANAAAIQQAMSLPEDQRFVAYGEASGLLDWFASRGVSQDQGRQCLADAGAIEALADQMQEQSEEDNITGTPTFFINGSRIDGTRWASVEPILQNAGAR